MKSFFKFFIIIVLIISVASCAMQNRVNVIKTSDIGSDRKIIMVPPGSSGILGVTKQVLSEKNWKMIALKGPNRTVGSFSKDSVDISQYTEKTANYILYVQEQFMNYDCYPNFNDYAGEPLTSHFRYSVSIVDWRSGEEILTIGGSGCLYDIVKNLQTNISQ